MADNYLEKHYAEYESRKAAWKQGGSRKNSKPLSILKLSLVYLPSLDFSATSLFYVRYFGFVQESEDTLSLPNSEFSIHLFHPIGSETLHFQFKIVSKYQFDQLILRLREDNITFSESEFSLSDPSGNIIDIKM